ncbi:fibronectin type III domain-containing protein [Paenibacillus sonchi]|uniref:hypothetical protein n=1 Tax=Paenibacillus sonchi TaxID=373687 RepID=UPI0002EC91E2|nr:hypothetical protein [Paenibacillus sonchi]
MKKIILTLAFLMFSLFSVQGVFAASGDLTLKMTSNTAPSGQAFSIGEEAGKAYQAFDKIDLTTDDDWSTTHALPIYMGYDFKIPKVITQYTITAVNGSIYVDGLPKTWTFEGWNGTSWVVIDTRTNQPSWKAKELRKYTIESPGSFSKYQLNITADFGAKQGYRGNIAELQLIGDISEPPILQGKTNGPTNELTWTKTEAANSYNIKRGTRPNGPYENIATVTGLTYSYSDSKIQTGITYYYVVSATNENGESSNSNEVALTPQSTGRAILIVTMSTGLEKEFDLNLEEVNAFIAWYENKQAGTGTASYAINKHDNNKGPFTSRKDYVIFDRILTFEVSEYTKTE